METLNNVENLKQSSHEDILEFFDRTTFRGIYSNRIRNKKNPYYYRGSIEKITIDGKRSDICPYYLNVPVSCEIEEGPCEFNCK